jgi:hypothetical protein
MFTNKPFLIEAPFTYYRMERKEGGGETEKF